MNALDFEGGNGLTDVIVFVKDSSTLSLCPGLSGIGWYYPTPYVVLANNVNITFSGTSLGEEYVKAHISMRNECGFSTRLRKLFIPSL